MKQILSPQSLESLKTHTGNQEQPMILTLKVLQRRLLHHLTGQQSLKVEQHHLQEEMGGTTMVNKIRQFLSKEQKLKSAFHAIHVDMSMIENQNKALQQNMNEWIMHLNRENKELKEQVKLLEAKLDKLASVVDRRQLSLLEGI